MRGKNMEAVQVYESNSTLSKEAIAKLWESMPIVKLNMGCKGKGKKPPKK